jgi:hypothetical protein
MASLVDRHLNAEKNSFAISPQFLFVISEEQTFFFFHSMHFDECKHNSNKKKVFKTFLSK